MISRNACMHASPLAGPTASHRKPPGPQALSTLSALNPVTRGPCPASSSSDLWHHGRMRCPQVALHDIVRVHQPQCVLQPPHHDQVREAGPMRGRSSKERGWKMRSRGRSRRGFWCGSSGGNGAFLGSGEEEIIQGNRQELHFPTLLEPHPYPTSMHPSILSPPSLTSSRRAHLASGC